MTEAVPSPRLPGIDILRGIAVAAMIIYHFAWDLRYFGLIATDIVSHPVWQNFARGIAGTFLFLSGVSLVMLTRSGFDRARFLRRLAIIGSAALLVTVATYVAMPNAFIFFGILHSIALGSVLALPFLGLPPAATLAVASGVFALPFFFAHPAFDQPLLQWVGLGTRAPNTNDFVPPFPWLALVLAGVAAGRLIAQRPPGWLGIEPTGPLAFTARAGRWSLPIYLLHQPILMALVGAAALGIAPAGSDREVQDFRRACTESCGRAGGEAAMCVRYCGCAETEIRNAELWTPLLRNALTARQQNQVTAITDQCQARAK